jgi:selenocysteine-specific elongation factor
VHVVATAGHVDHGKSTLVRALTGQDPDRLEEEHRRGLSIRLGYCWTELPGAGEVAFVDVPGHERFVPTMLSGVGPVPAVLLVVAADDPWMPQAAEHLAVLDALGVEHGLLVVTRSDLADPAPALARARSALAATSLRDIPHVAVSGRTGAGLDTVREALTGLVSRLPDPDPGADVRLWVDRRFHVKGTGTVVTGTLPAGTVRVDDVLAWGDHPVRVRNVEALGRPRASVSGVARVALALAGRIPDDLGAGTPLVTPDAYVGTTTVDVRLRTSRPDARLPAEPVLHLGAASGSVHVRPLEGDHVRLVLGRSLPLRIGDRALLRDPGNRQVWGVEVLDPLPPALRRRGAARVRAKDLAAVDGSVAAEVAVRGVVRRDVLRRLGAHGDAAGALAVDDWLVAADRAERMRGALLEAVQGSGPEGITIGAAARAAAVPDPAVAVALLADQPACVVRDGRIHRRDATLPARWADGAAALTADLAADPLAAPDAGRLRELGLDGAALAALARQGLVLRVSDTVVLAPGADDEAVSRLAALAQPFTVSQARQVLGSSRRVVLPLLSYLDHSGRTVRLPDDTRRLR